MLFQTEIFYDKQWSNNYTAYVYNLPQNLKQFPKNVNID